MARYLSLPKELVAGPILFGKKLCASYSQFGSGQFEYFGVSGTFTVPDGVTNVRVTALGAGGAGECHAAHPCCNCVSFAGPGGGGGGFIVAEVAVTPGTACTIVVGAFPGGTTCMGTQVMAHGGCSGCKVCLCRNVPYYGQFCNSFCTGSGTPGAGGTTSNSGVTVLMACNGSKGMAGFCGTQCSMLSCFGSNIDNCLPCQCNACACCVFVKLAGNGGAAGSYMGNAQCSEFPGPLCTDFFACKAFNGEAGAINDLSVNIIKPRWPGEFVVSTSRCETFVAGTAAGFPASTYITSVFGGANSVPCCCDSTTRKFAFAGCGGGGSGTSHGSVVRQCQANYNQQTQLCCPCGISQSNGPSATTCANGGNGYFVVEY